MSDPMVLPRLHRVRGNSARSSTWWGKAFVRSFEETVMEPADLPRGRRLARSGRLGAVMVISGMASAVLDGQGEQPLIAQLRVRRLDHRAWQGFEAELARESGFLAALESGELPVELVEHTDQLGVELLPGPGDLETACECDAWVQPCLHALALLHQLAWHLDRDPYLLLLLRGRTREQLLRLSEQSPPEAGEAGSPVGEVTDRAARILRLSLDAPSGHGLADSVVAAYDEQISRLLGD